ncbi:MAG: thioredoxin domain-containing protein [Deltaproteobacteria bacterium]|nr:thioredoxin domain-containing protein [Deltaproteobacteria bacterium]
MNKTRILIISIVVCLLIGGGILMWSARQSGHPLGKLIGGTTLDKNELSSIKHITDDNFEVEVVEASKSQPILIDFYADWCFPCRMLDPILEELAKDMRGKAIIGRVNTDKNLIARKFGITKIPAIFIIRDGEVKGSFFGVVPKETMAKALADYGS